MPKQLYNIDQVSEITGLSIQTIYRRTRLKTFPEPEEVTSISSGQQKYKKKKHWSKTEINKWVKSNVKADKVKYIDKDKLMPEAEGMWKNANSTKKTPVARDRIRTIEKPKVDPFVEAVERSVQGQLVAETESQKRKRMVIWALLIAVIIVAVVIAI